jgi:hypothetical protein
MIDLSKLKTREDIAVLRSDKGNATVIFDIEDYKTVYDVLDTSSYREINKDPTNKIDKKVKSLINKMNITSKEKYSLTINNLRTPRFYDLPKIHKEAVPLRPIVSTSGSPTYELAKYLANYLKDKIEEPCLFVRDSEHLVKKLKDIQLSKDDTLACFDVVSLFTSVPVKDTLNIIKSNLGIDKLYLEALELCLSFTYILFDGQIYEQSEGAAMGSPLPPIIAQMFMIELELCGI